MRLICRTVLLLGLTFTGLDINRGLAEEPKLRASLPASKDTVSSVAYSPDGKTLATTSYDNAIRLWDAANGKSIKNLVDLEDKNANVLSATFSPNGKILASSNTGRSIKLWDIGTGKKTACLQSDSGAGWSPVFSPDGKSLAAVGKNIVVLWDIGAGKEIATFDAHKGKVYSVAFSPDGKKLVSVGADGQVKLWEVATGQNTATIGECFPYHACFSLDGKTVAVAGADGAIRFWDLESGKIISVLKVGNRIGYCCMAYSKDGKTLAAGSHPDQKVVVWDLVSGKPKATILSARGSVSCLAISPDGKSVAFDGWKTVDVWDIRADKQE